ncbi:MAG: hypothetical protein QOJ62_908 [Actinomycetota bacterium]|jgi:hypothetical protein|nr:hypothetical protein [Actinomycetota bacterium]
MTASPVVSPSTHDLAASRGVQIVVGLDRLRGHRGEIEALAQRCGAPVTGRSTWMMASVCDDPQPWGVLLRDPAGFLRAAAVLVEARGDAAVADVVTLAGTDPASQGHRGALLADDRLWARRLGIALAGALPSHTRGWAIEIGPIAADSATLEGFLAGFPQLISSAVEPIPMIRRQPDHDSAADYLSPAMRRTLRKATNRLAADACALEIRFTRSYTEIAELLPDIERCHRDRDHERGRTSDLDDDGNRATWHNRLRELALDGLLEVSTAHIEGALAAHVVGILDGETYRVLEGHFVTEWGRYAPGRLLEAAVVQRMLDDPTMTALDWMTSVAPESLLAANDAQPMIMLRAGLTSRAAYAG